jgi:hypothetical protein
VQGREVQAQSLPASQLCGEAAGIVSQDQWGAIRSLKERRVGNRAIARLWGSASRPCGAALARNLHIGGLPLLGRWSS